ncbi:MAG TPA: MYG1 family protein [Rhabdochlamydiaceae bacterium]
MTACAILLLVGLIDRGKILRTREPKALEECEYVCDVGGIYDPKIKRFDHHQADYQGEMSSAGMIWLYLKDQKIIDEPTYHFFNRSLILGVDAHDNGRVVYEIGHCSFSQIVSNFVPVVYDAPADVQNEAFFQALDFVHGHLVRLRERFNYIRECRQKVADAMAGNKKFMVFEEPMPWIDNFFDLGGEQHPALFVVMPSGGHWKLRSIPPNNEDRMNMRMPLPERWAGLQDQELKKATKIPGAIFCHKGKFISVWETKEDALKALDYVLQGVK